MRTLPLVLVITLVACLSRAQTDDAGFRPLFNGKDTSGWHLRNPQGHNSWSAEDGILKNTAGGEIHGTDLVTDATFKDFTVRFEYLVPEDSNSGFYLRGRHEIQILGDHAKAKATTTGNGSLYNFKAPDQFVSKPGDVWQTVEATIVGNRITVTHNGMKTHDNVMCDKPTGGQLDDRVDQPGPILLQGDHGTVWFRNLRIKELK